jgi:type I restriction enzyme R subunit
VIIEALERRAINFDDLSAETGQEDADPFDLLCHIAFNAPLRTRRERAEMVRKERSAFFDRYSPEARQILNELLDKYVEQGVAQFRLPDVLKVPPISGHGNVVEIADVFEGAESLAAAVAELQALLYAA